MKRVKHRVTIETEQGLRSVFSIIETRTALPGIGDDGNLMLSIKNQTNIQPYQTLDDYFGPYPEEKSMQNMHFSLHPSRKGSYATFKLTNAYQPHGGETKTKVTAVLKTIRQKGRATPVFTFYAPLLTNSHSIKKGDKSHLHCLGFIDQTKRSLVATVYATPRLSHTSSLYSFIDNTKIINFSFWSLIILYGGNFAPSTDCSSISYISGERPIDNTKEKQTPKSGAYSGIDITFLPGHHQLQRRLTDRTVLKQINHYFGLEAFNYHNLGMSLYTRLY